MKITQAVSSTLLVAITEAIQNGVATEYGTYEFPQDWEHNTTNALGEEFTKALTKALDGSSLRDFVSDQIRLIAVESAVARPKSEIPIVKLKGFSDALGRARRIVRSLEEIPLQYRMIVRISGEFAERLGRSDICLSLSDRLRLVSGAMIPDTFRLEHENSDVNRHIRGYMFPGDAPFKLEDKALYLEFRTSGYLSLRRNSRAVGEFLDEVRAFYGACLAHNIISTFTHFGDEVTPVLIANSIVSGAESFAFVERVEEDIVRCANLSTTTDADERMKNAQPVEEILGPVVSVFRSANANKLKTACAWALRAHLSTRSLDKVLEATITIEVLLGDRDTSDRIGLSKLMANRCAYALGRSSDERDEIVEFFVRFYRLRSEVVHSGRTSLQSDERKIVNEGLGLATRILKHEIALAS